MDIRRADVRDASSSTVTPAICARRLITPVVLIAVIGALALATVIGLAAREQEHKVAEAEASVVGGALRSQYVAMSRLAKDFTWYDAAIERLFVHRDPLYSANTLGLYLNREHGVDLALVLDADDRQVFLAEDGLESPGDGLPRFQGGIETLIDQARASSPDEPTPATGLLLLDGRPVLAVVSAYTHEYNQGRVAGGDRGVLVIAHRLSPDVIAAIETSLQIPGLSIVADRQGDWESFVEIKTVDQSHTLFVAIPSHSHGRALINELAVPAGVTVIVVAGLLAVFLGRVRGSMERALRDGELLARSNADLDRSERQLRAIIAGVADGIVVADASGTINTVNAGAERLIGATSDQIVGRPFSAILGPAAAEASETAPGSVAWLDEHAAEHEREPDARRHAVARRWDGLSFVAELSVTRATFDGQTLYVAILRDVSERRRAEETLNLLSTGMILVGEGSRILLCNRSAERVLGRGDMLGNVDGRLRAVAEWHDKELQALIGNALAVNGRFPLGSGAINLYSTPGTRPVHVVVTPLRLTEGPGGGYPVAAIIMRASETQTEIRPELLRQLYGLTKAESRVVAELARGKRLTEVAETLNVSVNTVRNQLKQAFTKTSTNRQADLVSLVLTSVSDLAQEDAPEAENPAA